MKAFADLYTALDATNKTSEKLAALIRYFQTAPPGDAAWAVYFLSGYKPRQIVPNRKLVDWAMEAAGVRGWLFSESYEAVGDMAETITLLLPIAQASSDLPLQTWVEERLLPLRRAGEAVRREAVRQAWHELNDAQRFVYNKLITGAFRVGVSQRMVTRALAQVSGLADAVIAHRLMGAWEPNAAFYTRLLADEVSDAVISRPYPFCLAFPLDEPPEALLGDPTEWQVEWKWDGIRAQLIQRHGQVFIWSRGEELVTDRYPEVALMATHLPDGTVLDGELLPWAEGRVLPFAQLQRRIGRKTLDRKLLAEVPVGFMAYDLIELDSEDIRELPLIERRARMEKLTASLPLERLMLSPIVEETDWNGYAGARESAPERNVEGLMLKRRSSPYKVGRHRGDWWKWKIDPYLVDAVLIYAQRGSGKRASLYTDYTFGVWDENGSLVPFAKAYSGLTDAEIREVDAYVRRNTVEKFGPVRTVRPELVFELAFAGIQQSSRHKSGIAVRFPRINRWRRDKPAAEADTIATVRALLPR
ncbi:MAG TPA: ATP-dependent DNA ligase [Anaerolineaceae bacterium]|nr:ATP-dependent DNA ligase [Anaerolineaceae bacterium]